MTTVFARIDVTEREGITIAKFIDRKVIDRQTIDDWKDEMLALVKERRGRILIDLSLVDFLSSLALNSILEVQRVLQTQFGGMLCLCSMRFEIMEVFLMTRLNTCIYIVKDVDEAVGAPWKPMGWGK